MFQLVVCRNKNGIVLATYSKALEFVPPEKVTDVEINRLLPLGERAAILCGGALEGYPMCQKLQSFIEGEGLSRFQSPGVPAVTSLPLSRRW
jgi:hypothetical protein